MSCNWLGGGWEGKTSKAAHLRQDQFGPRMMLLLHLIAFLLLAILSGCAANEHRIVATQNEQNIAAFSGSVAKICSVSRALAANHLELCVRAARERVAADLISVRSLITIQSATEQEISDPASPWVRALEAEADALRERLTDLPADQVEEAGTALAAGHPVTTDLALRTPGFTTRRVVQDAVTLDELNTRIEAETADVVRAALAARRDALLDAYLPARIALRERAEALRSLDAHIAIAEEQSRIAQVHAQAMRAATANPPADAPVDMYRDPALRAAILDLIREIGGDAGAETARDRLARIDAILLRPSP